MPEIEITLTLTTPIQKAWDILSNMENIGSCIPEVKEVQVLDEINAVWTLNLKVGFITKKIKVKSKVVELDPPKHAVFEGRAEERDFGLFLRGIVDLKPVSDKETKVSYKMSIEANGPLSGMINDLIRRKIDKDTDKIVEKLRNMLL